MNGSRLAFAVLACLLSSGAAGRQTPTQTTQSKPNPQPAGQAQPATPGNPADALTAAELQEILGPIALYPDTLLANVLAAAVYPDEVKEAAAFVGRGGGKDQVDSQTWEAPVKSIAKVPEVAKMMGEYPDWTTALGQAYLTQAQDVMATVQALRKKAQSNGTLQTTPQQKVVVEQETIYIQSPDPQVVYVPSYQPSVVYVDDPYDNALAAGLVGFGAGVVVGAVWADLACDWNHGCVGWGDVDINRNFNGDINIGNDVNVGSGNRVDHRARPGNEGNAWAPNRNKPLATSRPSQAANFRGETAAAANRASGTPRPASTRTPTSAAPRPATTNRPASTPAARPAATSTGSRAQSPSSASRMPNTPPAQRSPSAFQGGSGTKAASQRGSSSRQSASRSSGSRPQPSRSSGGGGRSRGGGGRR